MKAICKCLISDLYYRKKTLVFFLIVLFASAYFIQSALYYYFNAEYRILSVRRVLKDQNMLNIKVIPWIIDKDYYTKFEEFEKELKELYGEDYGKMMYMNVVQNKEEILTAANAESPYSPGINTLFVEGICAQLCKNKMDMKLLDGSNDIKNPVLVGEKIKHKYPFGSKIYNLDTDNTYDVVGQIPPNTEWIGSNPFSSNTVVVNLDDCIICKMDNDYFKHHKEYYGNCFQSIYIRVSIETMNKSKEIIKDIARKHDIKMNVYSIEESIQNENEKRRTWIETGGNLTIFAVVISIISSAIAVISDCMYRRRNIGIMLILGISEKQLIFTLFVENSIRIIVSSSLALVFFMREYSFVSSIIIYRYILPSFLFVMIIMIALITLLVFIQIHNKKTLDMIREVRL